ncbi:MAG TPA: hypothetical protein VFC34_16695 [Puia sp.]|nr:hypothetical protein [Puia sp.]
MESVVYTNYGRQKHLGTYIGNWDDPLLARSLTCLAWIWQKRVFR